MSVVLARGEWEHAAIAARNEKVRSACGVECGLGKDRQFESPDEALAIRRSARSSARCLMVGEYYRFGEGARIMHDLLADGAVGEVQRREIEVPSRPSDHTLAATPAELTRALREKGPPAGNIDDNMRTLSIVFGAIRSASERRTVAIDEMFEDPPRK
jgi:predicted dehydrogenase